MAKSDVTLECPNGHFWFSEAWIFADELTIEEPECPECGQTWKDMRASLPDRKRKLATRTDGGADQ